MPQDGSKTSGISSDTSIPRRTFLRQSVAAAGLVGGAMAGGSVGQRSATAAATARAAGANERIRIGIIGAGGRGQDRMNRIFTLADEHNVEVVAVCDVWKVNLDAAADKVAKRFGKKPKTYTRFGELLANDAIDAVVIATPDFAHTPIMIEALKAGKDVYCEKPMAMELDNANIALDLARKHERVVQIGTQRRSDGVHPAAARQVAEGILGKISRVSVQQNFNHPRWLRDYSNCKQADVDWEAYLFNRKPRPFDPKLLRRWHLYKACTNGLSGLWMCHHVDAAHLLTGAGYPARAAALGGTYVWKEDREHCDTFHALIEYPEGFLFDWGMGLANSANCYFKVHGLRGTLDLDKRVFSGDGGLPNDKIKEPIKIAVEQGESHMGNWLTCLRTRKRPTPDIEFGHQHSVATIMAATALETGQRQTYDPATRTISAG